MIARATALGCALLTLAVAPAARASEAIDALLLKARTPAEVRGSLLAYATSAPDSARADKGAALLDAGMSYEQAGRADSALLCYERAVAARGSSEDRDAFVDALLERGNAGDAPRALEILKPRLQTALTSSERDIAVTRGRQAWAYYIMERGDSALAIFESQKHLLLDPVTPRQRDWRYRVGLVELEHGSPGTSIETMFPLAMESRFQDRDVMGVLKDASQKAPQGPQMGTYMKQELARIDAQDAKSIAAFRGRRITFTALDGFTVGAIVVPAHKRPARAAIVLTDPEEVADAYDSLAAGLSAAGYALVIVEARGSGWSVSPSCPLSSTWHGREEQMRSLVARDALPALRALAAKTPVDTSSFLLVGALNSCSIAAQAATLGRRARAVLLLAPSPTPVEQGPMRARLADSGAPVFFEVPVMDHTTGPIAEALYEGLDPRTSRISESEIIGSAATVFRYDKSALPRLLRWLDDTWGSKRASSETRKGRKP